MPKRALTTHKRPAWMAPVVGTLSSDEVSVPRGIADDRRPLSRKTWTSPALRTTNSLLPRSSNPSPLATLAAPVEICVATPVVLLTRKRPPVNESTTISEFRVATIPFALN